MYNAALRSRLEHPESYEIIATLIQAVNPACTSLDWAYEAINLCIREALEHGDASTGMATAHRVECRSAPILTKCRLSLEVTRAAHLREPYRSAVQFILPPI